MIDLVAAKRLMLMGASDLDVSTRRTIAAGRWAEGPSGWQCTAPGGRQVLVQRDGRGLFLHVMEQGGRFVGNMSVSPC
jgi:hypothetical protein